MHFCEVAFSGPVGKLHSRFRGLRKEESHTRVIIEGGRRAKYFKVVSNCILHSCASFYPQHDPNIDWWTYSVLLTDSLVSSQCMWHFPSAACTISFPHSPRISICGELTALRIHIVTALDSWSDTIMHAGLTTNVVAKSLNRLLYCSSNSASGIIGGRIPIFRLIFGIIIVG